MDAIGTHCLAELYDCPAGHINDIEAVALAMRQAVRAMGAELIREAGHQFTPQGVTVLGLLAESHISIHTWPERGYVAVDAFTCGTRCQPRDACEFLASALKSKRHVIRGIVRGGEGISQVPALPDLPTGAGLLSEMTR